MSSSQPSRFINEIDARFLEFAGGKNIMPRSSAPPLKTRDLNPASKLGNLVPLPKREGAAPPKNERPTADEYQNIKPGMTVEHHRLGIGKVLAMDGSGDNARATIHFRASGQKQLLLKFARLQVVR